MNRDVFRLTSAQVVPGFARAEDDSMIKNPWLEARKKSY